MAKASDEQSRYAGQERCASPSGGGEGRKASEVQPLSDAQIDAEYKLRLISDLARIEKKYEWTDPDKNTNTIFRKDEKKRFTASHQGADHHKVKEQEIALVTGINGKSRDFIKTWNKEKTAYLQEIQKINKWQGDELIKGATAAAKQKIQDDKERDKQLAALNSAMLSPERLAFDKTEINRKSAQAESIRNAYMQPVNEEHDRRIIARQHAYAEQQKRSIIGYESGISALRKQYWQGVLEMDAPYAGGALGDVGSFSDAKRKLDQSDSKRFILAGLPIHKNGVTTVTYVDPKVHEELGWITNLSEAQKKDYQAHQVTYTYDSSANVTHIGGNEKASAVCKLGKTIIEMKDGKTINAIKDHGETPVAVSEAVQPQRPSALLSLAEALRRGSASSSVQRLEESRSRSPSLERG